LIQFAPGPELPPSSVLGISAARQVGLGMNAMDINTAAIDDAVLALLFLTVHDDNRAWKNFDWDALNRLHDRGLIGDRVNKAKSVIFTDAGLRESECLFKQYFVDTCRGTDRYTQVCLPFRQNFPCVNVHVFPKKMIGTIMPLR
jgi:hypothetical protein